MGRVDGSEQMRITCPNCDAQYEVPTDVIPSEGRDVQCSSCGQTWLQHHPDHQPVGMAPVPDPDVLPEPEPVVDIPGPDETFFETPVAPPPEAPEPRKRSLDPEVAEILRQEAAREREARAQETTPLETQPELGLSEGDDLVDARAQATQRRMSAMRGEVSPAVDEAQSNLGNIGEAATAAAAMNARRDLLPDIEEINSTLRSTSDRDIAGDDPRPEAPIIKRKRRGFRRGFLLAVLLILIALLIYIFAPQLADLLPWADSALSNYVAWVDGLRLRLDGLISNMLAWLDTQAAASQN